MTTLGSPNMDWIKLSEGFGVPAVSVDSAEGLARALEKALAGIPLGVKDLKQDFFS